MATSPSAKFKKFKKTELTPTLAPPKEVAPTPKGENAPDKEKLLDELFAKFPSAADHLPKTNSFSPPQATSQLAGTQIYSTFGGGSIVINGREVKLPITITNPQEFLYLKEFYGVDSAGSPLRSRRI